MKNIEEWLKAGNVIKKAATRKAKGYTVKTKFKAHSHMNTKAETHVYWKYDENIKQNALQK